MKKTYCLNDYGPEVLTKVKQYVARSVLALERVKLADRVDQLVEQVRYKNMSPNDELTFTLRWVITANDLLGATGLAILNLESEDIQHDYTLIEQKGNYETIP
jgi:hypothetical protein